MVHRFQLPIKFNKYGKRAHESHPINKTTVSGVVKIQRNFDCSKKNSSLRTRQNSFLIRTNNISFRVAYIIGLIHTSYIALQKLKHVCLFVCFFSHLHLPCCISLRMLFFSCFQSSYFLIIIIFVLFSLVFLLLFVFIICETAFQCVLSCKML
jgi:hypothetical protein